MNTQQKREVIKIQGMHCTNCALGIEKHLKKTGLVDVNVDFASSSLNFQPDNNYDAKRVRGEIEKLGYSIIQNSSTTQKSAFLSSLEAKLAFSLIFTLPLLFHMILPWHVLHSPWVQLALCLPVFILGFLHFGRSALRSLASGMPNMDVLILTGITAAFVYSLIGTLLGLGPAYLFYETSASITSLVFLGNLLEQRSVKRTTSAIEELTAIQAQLARLVHFKDGQEEILEVDAREVTVGDVLLINQGDKLPADGEVIWGSASLDEAMISGESLPVEKRSGDRVTGGTILKAGSIKIRATAVGNDTVIAAMIRLVQESTRSRPQIQRIGDKVSAVFVQVVILIAIATILISWFLLQLPFQEALMRAIAVLVVACPCAMGLATPTAVMVGVGHAARAGILIKGGSTLETLAQIKRIVFDKTGTLTHGQLGVSTIQVAEIERESALSALLGLERHSSHPIAHAIRVALVGHKALEMTDIRETAGVGISGTGADQAQYEVRTSPREEASGIRHTDLTLFKDGQALAALDLREELDPQAKEAIATLQSMGIETALLSGDSRKKCEAVAEAVGISEMHWEQSPAQKLQVIADYQKQKPTAYMGDGINDAPALALAAVGISLSRASDAAINSAQVVLLSGHLGGLLSAVRTARLTFRTIKQNLFWAFFYNALTIPLAAAGYLDPMIAALSMAFSDVIVVGNSLRLRLRRL